MTSSPFVKIKPGTRNDFQFCRFNSTAPAPLNHLNYLMYIKKKKKKRITKQYLGSFRATVVSNSYST